MMKTVLDEVCCHSCRYQSTMIRLIVQKDQDGMRKIEPSNIRPIKFVMLMADT
jgi:hypothetical protein